MLNSCIHDNPCCKHSIEKEYELGHIVIYCRKDKNEECPSDRKYSFPYSINPDCLDCDYLHVDKEDDNIKRWCDFPKDRKCHLTKTYTTK